MDFFQALQKHCRCEELEGIQFLRQICSKLNHRGILMARRAAQTLDLVSMVTQKLSYHFETLHTHGMSEDLNHLKLRLLNWSNSS